MLAVKKVLASACTAAALTVGIAGPASAQQTQTGLVNVAVEDVVIQVPVGVAATVCGVNAAVIAANFSQTTDPVCTAQNNQLPVAFQV